MPSATAMRTALGLSRLQRRVSRRCRDRALVRGAAGRGDGQGAESPRQAANWLTSELFGALNRLGKDLARFARSTRSRARSCSALVGDGTISGSIAKQVFEIMLETGEAMLQDRRARGPEAESDTGAIEAAVAKVLADNADKVEQYKGGKEALFGFFVGQTMKAMQGKANPQVVNELLKKGLRRFLAVRRRRRFSTRRQPRCSIRKRARTK
jgi:aspartyl-tRNA(Asn)/glutamyl-tRNA(Gln) amidotransferase subunit B